MNQTAATPNVTGLHVTDDALPLHRFHVRVGLAECTVTCHTPDEAVRLARVRIAEKMPQVRTLLGNIFDKEFHVDRAE